MKAKIFETLLKMVSNGVQHSSITKAKVFKTWRILDPFEKQ